METVLAHGCVHREEISDENHLIQCIDSLINVALKELWLPTSSGLHLS